MKMVRVSSELTEVVVHARGAVITRRVEVPEGVSGEVEVVVEGIGGRVEAGTVRVRLDPAKARLVSVRSRVEEAAIDSLPGVTRRRVEELEVELGDLEAECGRLEERLRRWTAARVAPRGVRALREEGPHNRAKDALELMAVARGQREKLSEALWEKRRERDRVRRALEVARLEDEQASSAARKGERAPRLFVIVHLADVEELEGFELFYVVDDARWWPTYTVNLDSENRAVSLDLEAVVAQRSGEDWSGVRLAVSTAELNTDARLPTLASQRLGRRQGAVPKSGYRPPPPGLDELFRSYDRDRAQFADLPEAPGGKDRRKKEKPDLAKEMMYGGSMDVPAPAAMESALPPALASGGEAPKKSGKRVSRSVLGGVARKAAPEAAGEIEPGEGWLHFERLRLGGPESAYRGKLYRLSDDLSRLGSADGLAWDAGAGLVDPVASRGSFDYRYDGEGHVRIVADGHGHRVQLQRVGGPCAWTYRCVPRAEAAVYREVCFVNPLDAALLDGPARIFVDGEFRSRSRLTRVDRGGAIRLGLGVEERIQVIRNTRFEEEGAGLLGGKRDLDHEVEIRLRSSLPMAIEVEVVDRIPISDDESVSVTLLSEEPSSRGYDQSDREGATLRGGRLWEVSLGAGGEAKVRYGYQVRIRTRDELVGGNRREG